MEQHKITFRGTTFVVGVRPAADRPRALLLGQFGVINDTGDPKANQELAAWLVRSAHRKP